MKAAPGQRKTRPGRPKMLAKHPKRHPKTPPRTLQHTPKKTQNPTSIPKTTQDHPKTAQDAQKTPQNAPRWCQDTPKTSPKRRSNLGPSWSPSWEDSRANFPYKTPAKRKKKNPLIAKLRLAPATLSPSNSPSIPLSARSNHHETFRAARTLQKRFPSSADGPSGGSTSPRSPPRTPPLFR